MQFSAELYMQSLSIVVFLQSFSIVAFIIQTGFNKRKALYTPLTAKRDTIPPASRLTWFTVMFVMYIYFFNGYQQWFRHHPLICVYWAFLFFIYFFINC